MRLPSTHLSVLLALQSPASPEDLRDQAWQQFVARYLPVLDRWVQRRIPREDQAHAVAVQILADLRERICLYKQREGVHFRSWLATVVSHALTNWRRDHAHLLPPVPGQRLVEEIVPDDQLEQLAEDMDAATWDKVADVQRALARAETEFGHRRIAIFLRWWTMLPEPNWEKLGPELGVKAGTLRAWINQVRHFLAEDLKKYRPADPIIPEAAP